MQLLFLLDVLLIFTSAYLFIAMCRLPSLAASIVGLWIMAYGSIVLIGLIVAELGFLNAPFAHFIGHLLLLAVIALIWHLRKRPRINFSPLAHQFIPRSLISTLRTAPDVFVLVAGTSLLYLLGIYLIWSLPYGSHDSMAYHLARIGYWLQHNSLRPYPTYEILQTSFPVNSSLTMLWLILFWGSDQLVGLVQWLAVLGTVPVIYGLARLIGGSRRQSLFAALLWPTLPVVILQSTTTLNDMVTAFLATTTTYFLLFGIRRHSYSALLLSGLALGLAFGTKGTIYMFLPSLLVAGLFFLVKDRLTALRPLLFWGGACATGILLFGFYIYFINFVTYANPLGPHAERGTATVANPTPETIVTNIARYLYQMADTAGVPANFVAAIQPSLAQAGHRTFEIFHLDPNLPAATRPTTAFTFDGSPPNLANVTEIGPLKNRNHEVFAWYGPLGFLLFLPAILFSLIFAPIRGQYDRWLLALMATTYFFVLCYLMRWSPYRGRFMATAMAVSTPLLIIYFQRGWGGRILRWGIVSLTLFFAFWTATHNLAKPLLGPTSIFDVDRAAQRGFYGGQIDFVRAIETYLPSDARVGLVGYQLWEYPLFGPNFSRTIKPLFPPPDKIDAQSLKQNQLNYLVVSSYLVNLQPDIADDIRLLTQGHGWKIFTPVENFPNWLTWATNQSTPQTQSTNQSLFTVSNPIRGSTQIDLHLPPHGVEQLGQQPVLWLGEEQNNSIEGIITSARNQSVQLALDTLPLVDKTLPVEFTFSNPQGTWTETRSLNERTEIQFELPLQEGENSFTLITPAASDNSGSQQQKPTLLISQIELDSIAATGASTLGPTANPLVLVDTALANSVGVEPDAQIPWPLDIENDRPFLWLGQGEAGGLGGTILSNTTQPVVLNFDVSPGPARSDQQRTVQMVNQSGDEVVTQTETFNQATVINFPVQLQAGRNHFQFTVLDEPTQLAQADGETRPLLVRLNQITIRAP
ncbi:MAG: glycosyltransferase family 39 protein [Anaerolineae bacterium]|nr:glycosyltransferase family 39 protein [Anaerolineae bacterium]